MRLLPLLFFLACGGLGPALTEAITPEQFDTAAGVLAVRGPPCSREGTPGGVEAWGYCCERCPPPEEYNFCQVPCAEGCQPRWVYHFVAGHTVRVERPE